MRIVAREAFPSLEGIVQDRSPRLYFGFVVALVAERTSLLRRAEGFWRSGRGVARVATLLDHGIVGAFLQELCPGGGVRIVATRAGGRFHGVIPMRIFEPSFPRVMTGKAKGRLRLYEQIVLVRAVRMVAGPASLLLDDGMNDLLLIGLFLVALVARFRAFRLEEVAPLGGVRVVAGDAFSGPQRGVHPGQVQTDLFFRMAGVAQVVPLLFQQELGNDPVPEMTVFALPVFHAGMNAFEGEIFLRELLMAIEASLPLELPLLRKGGSAVNEECRCGKEKNGKAHENPFEGGGRHTLSRVDGGNVIWPLV